MGKDYLGKDMRRGAAEEKEEEKEIKALDEGDIQLLKTYGQGPYSKSLKQVEQDIAETIKKVNELAGIKVILNFSLHVFDSDQSCNISSGVGHWAWTSSSLGLGSRQTDFAI